MLLNVAAGITMSAAYSSQSKLSGFPFDFVIYFLKERVEKGVIPYVRKMD